MPLITHISPILTFPKMEGTGFVHLVNRYFFAGAHQYDVTYANVILIPSHREKNLFAQQMNNLCNLWQF